MDEYPNELSWLLFKICPIVADRSTKSWLIHFVKYVSDLLGSFKSSYFVTNFVGQVLPVLCSTVLNPIFRVNSFRTPSLRRNFESIDFGFETCWRCVA